MWLSTGPPAMAKTHQWCLLIVLLCCFKGTQQKRISTQVIHNAIVKLDEKMTDFVDNKLQERFNGVEDSLNLMNTKIADIEQTLSFITERLGTSIADMDQKLDRVHNRMVIEKTDLDQNMSKMHNSMTHVFENIEHIKGDLVHLNNKAQSTEIHIKGLKDNSTEQNTENVNRMNSDIIYLKSFSKYLEKSAKQEKQYQNTSMNLIFENLENIKGVLVKTINDKVHSTDINIAALKDNSTENSVSSLKKYFKKVFQKNKQIREQIVNELQEVKQNTENVNQINSDMIYLKGHIDKIERTVIYLNDDNENIKQYHNRTYEVFQNIEKHENDNSRHLKSLKFNIISIGRTVQSCAEKIKLYQNSTNEILKTIEIRESDSYNSTHETLKNIEICESDNYILLQTINYTTHSLVDPIKILKSSELISGKTVDETFRNESLKYLSTIQRYTAALQDPISVIKQMILFNSADGIHTSQLLQTLKKLTEILQESLIKSVDNIQKDIKNFENAHSTAVTNNMNAIANFENVHATSVTKIMNAIANFENAHATDIRNNKRIYRELRDKHSGLIAEHSGLKSEHSGLKSEHSGLIAALSNGLKWTPRRNACIDGHNIQTYYDVSWSRCKQLCIDYGHSCEAVEYADRSKTECRLSDATSSSSSYSAPCHDSSDYTISERFYH